MLETYGIHFLLFLREERVRKKELKKEREREAEERKKKKWRGERKRKILESDFLFHH